jgi:tetratricopeptide (TPR) repeat protein
VDEALTGDLSGYMRELAENLRSELIILQAPLPEHVLRGVTRAVKFLDQGKNEEALEVCDKILEGEAELGGPSRGKFLTLKGRALEALGRNFAAVDAYSRALPYIRSKEGMAVVYFHMGSLFLQMGNPAQAQGAFTIALEYGLPSGLELQAREALQASGEQLQGDR